ncbi:MAG: YbjN domain-containing protein [Clostridiales bacterium]|nr:YbjN domain-containing protein [Clostridiales bacterium]
MRLTRCTSGHFYDAEKYSRCPHCGNSGREVQIAQDSGAKITKCINGHFYDANKHGRCPICGSSDDYALRVISITQNFEQFGIEKHKSIEYEGKTVFQLGIAGEQTNYEFVLILLEDGGVEIQVANYIKIKPEKRLQILEAINQCNAEVRFATFVLRDENMNIVVKADLPSRISAESTGAAAVEMLVRLCKIMDDKYPLFMKILWS